jgi:hypothetical protein
VDGDSEIEHFVRELAFSYWTPDMFPTLSDLEDELRASSHQRIPHQELCATLSSLLRPWLRDGRYGSLVDGASNVDLGTSGMRPGDPLRVIHIELGKISKTESALRAVAGFLVTNQVRTGIEPMPRNIRKQVVIEEMVSFLKVPNAAEIVVDYYFLKVSWLSSGTLTAPITETTLYEQPYSVALYGANLYDDALNYLSLDAAIAAFPPNTGGNLIVRRGTFDPIGQVVNYGPDSAVLRTTGAISCTGTITINSLSGNANIPENINGVATYTANAVGRIFISAGAFAIRNYNWRASVNSTYNTILVYQLIGAPGNFTGITAQYAFTAQSPDSPTGFYEIPLPTNANGISFAVYAGVQTGVNQYTLIADGFPLGTVYGTNWIDAHAFSQTAPFTVTNLSANAIAGHSRTRRSLRLKKKKRGPFTETAPSKGSKRPIIAS